MRKVKYKFWDVRNKIMLQWTDLQDTSIKSKQLQGLLYDFIHNVKGNIIPLEFIGCKDQQNIEIYEGDYYQTDEITWEVYFGKNGFDGKRSLGWCIKDIDSGNTYAFDLNMKKGKVIGNIYESRNIKI